MTRTDVQFNRRHIAKIEKAADRAYKLLPPDLRTPDFKMNTMMDLAAADGVNGNPPIDWDRLLAADNFNFIHDVGGIGSHMDRVTGKLGGFFLPRFTRKPANTNERKTA